MLGLIILGLVYLAENPLEKREKNNFFERTVYRVLSVPGYRKPRAHFVSIVDIEEGEDPPKVITDRCSRREYIAQILGALKNQNPAVVVLDFSPDSPEHCLAATNNQIRAAIADISNKTQVVIGENSLDMQHLMPNDVSALEKVHARENDLLLVDPDWISPDANSTTVTYGLTNTILDNRSVPIALFVWKKDADDHYIRQPVDSLSAAAVKAFQPSAPEIRAAAEHSMPPLTAFMEDEAFPHVDAASIVLCGDTAKLHDEWKKCLPSDIPRSELRHRIVIVALGQNHEHRDYLSTVVGRVPGHVLQANYIEALLDDRLMWQPSKTLQLALMLAVFLAVQVAIHIEEDRPLKGLINAFALISALFIIAWCSTVMTGWYFDFWAPGITGMAVAFAENVTERFRRHAISPEGTSSPGTL
jgi:CHASE2 domain-containing sensor protein